MKLSSDLSIIIPSYRSKYLNQAIESVRPLRPLEIIVVDSSPVKPEVRDGVTLLHLDGRVSPGAARNTGARLARGSYLLFLDSDVLMPQSTCSFIENFLSDPRADILSGLYDVLASPGGFFSQLQNRILEYRILEQFVSGIHLFSSSHFLAKKSIFEKVGGFNEEIWSYEDVEFAARCRGMNCPPMFSPELKGLHLKKFNFISYFVDYFHKSFNAFQVRGRYPHVFKNTSAHLGKTLSLSWATGALSVLSLWLIFVPKLFLPPAVIPCLLWIFSALILIPSLRVRRLAFLAKVLLTWPLIGFAVASGTAASAVIYYIRRVRDSALFVWDLMTGAWRVFLMTGMPVQIIAYVTSRCNLRCEHCFYKETLDTPNPGELPLDIFNATTRNIGPVLWFSLAGGEPFLRKDLVQLVEVIQNNCRPKVFSFPTNGWYTERTFDACLRILQKLKRGNLILFFSLDGPNDIHDQIRGPGSFARVKATMERLRPLEAMYDNFYLNIVTTVTERNALTAVSFVEELVRDWKPSAISINLFRYHSLTHPPLSDGLIEGYRAAVEVYVKHLRRGALKHYGFFGGRILLLKEILQKELIYRVAKNGEFVTPCVAGTLSYVIMEDGRVSPCEILPDIIGNITDTNTTFSQMTRSKSAHRLRRWIRDTECKCTYECAMSTNTLFSWPMSKRLAKGFLQELVPGRNGPDAVLRESIRRGPV